MMALRLSCWRQLLRPTEAASAPFHKQVTPATTPARVFVVKHPPNSSTLSAKHIAHHHTDPLHQRALEYKRQSIYWELRIRSEKKSFCQMPPRKQKQTAFADASTSSNENMPSFPAPPTMVLTRTGDEETHTPRRSPEKRGAATITEAQKQALMDNLQLEGKLSWKGRGSNTCERL